MEHSFNTKIAKEYGIEEAIILQHLYFWIEKNKANKKHFHNGRYWTYNSSSAIHEIFDYIPSSTISRKLKNLETKGLILIDNFNDNKYDRTQWFALTDFAEELLDNGCLKMENPFLKMKNGDEQNEKTIPYNKPNIYKEIIDYFNENCPSFPKCRTLSKKRKDAISARLKVYTFDDFKEVCTNAEGSDFLKGTNNRNWKADFDWIMCDSNFAKVLEGKYNKNNKQKVEVKQIDDGLFSI